MNDDQLNDLKQFITVTVSQQLNEFEQRVNKRFDQLEQKMNDGFTGVSEALEGINQHQAEQDTRLTNLESAKV